MAKVKLICSKKSGPLKNCFSLTIFERGSPTGKPPVGGQSILEMLIALGVAVAAIAGAIVVIFGGQSLSIDSQLSNQGINLARQNLESAQAIGQNNFGALVSGSSTQNGLLVETIVQNIDAYTKLVTSRVSWQAAPNRPQKAEFTTLVTDAQDVVNTGGDTGGTGLSGNWNNPVTLGSINLGPGEQATDLDVVNGIVYMTATASAVSKPDFFVVNATNGQNPYIVSSLDTGPGLNAVDATLKYAYVANNKTSSQLQIIDISNAANPLLIASYTLPGVSGNGAVGNSIFYYNSKIYIGTKAATGPEFHVIDVSNPNAPQEIGSYKIGADVNAIRVAGNTAYLATSDDDKELYILDVSNPGAIALKGTYDAPLSDAATSLYLVGGIAYLGRAGGSAAFLILDVSNPSSVRLLSQTNIGNAVNAIVVRDTLAFLGTAVTNQEFQVWDISSSSNPSRVATFNFPNIATGLDYENNFVYCSVRSNDGLRIITSQ